MHYFQIKPKNIKIRDLDFVLRYGITEMMIYFAVFNLSLGII